MICTVYLCPTNIVIWVNSNKKRSRDNCVLRLILPDLSTCLLVLRQSDISDTFDLLCFVQNMLARRYDIQVRVSENCIDRDCNHGRKTGG